MPHNLLVDTCVWLDLAKDARNLPVIAAVEELQRAGVVSLIVPDTVKEEFSRNKDRVVRLSQQNLKTHFRLVRTAVESLTDNSDKALALEALSEVDRRVKVDSQDVTRVFDRIEELLNSVTTKSATSEQLVSVAKRALTGRAPFHNGKNNASDALLIEIYASCLQAEHSKQESFAFVTLNYRDFSMPQTDRRQPHEDLQELFADGRSTYWLSLPDLLNSIDQDLLPNHDLEFSGWNEHRRLSEIVEAENFLFNQVWYNRHWGYRIAIEEGRIKVVSETEYDRTRYRGDQILDSIWAGALGAAERTEEILGEENLGPWDDFEWGMINGKLSALRWVLGDEWDMLDT